VTKRVLLILLIVVTLSFASYAAWQETRTGQGGGRIIPSPGLCLSRDTSFFCAADGDQVFINCPKLWPADGRTTPRVYTRNCPECWWDWTEQTVGEWWVHEAADYDVLYNLPAGGYLLFKVPPIEHNKSVEIVGKYLRPCPTSTTSREAPALIQYPQERPRSEQFDGRFYVQGGFLVDTSPGGGGVGWGLIWNRTSGTIHVDAVSVTSRDPHVLIEEVIMPWNRDIYEHEANGAGYYSRGARRFDIKFYVLPTAVVGFYPHLFDVSVTCSGGGDTPFKLYLPMIITP
jgi:hypothetical protein